MTCSTATPVARAAIRRTTACPMAIGRWPPRWAATSTARRSPASARTMSTAAPATTPSCACPDWSIATRAARPVSMSDCGCANRTTTSTIPKSRSSRRTGGWELGLNHREYLGASTLDMNLAYRRGTGAFRAMPAPEEDFGEGTSRMQVITADAQWLIPFQRAARPLYRQLARPVEPHAARAAGSVLHRRTLHRARLRRRTDADGRARLGVAQ